MLHLDQDFLIVPEEGNGNEVPRVNQWQKPCMCCFHYSLYLILDSHSPRLFMPLPIIIAAIYSKSIGINKNKLKNEANSFLLRQQPFNVTYVRYDTETIHLFATQCPTLIPIMDAKDVFILTLFC